MPAGLQNAETFPVFLFLLHNKKGKIEKIHLRPVREQERARFRSRTRL